MRGEQALGEGRGLCRMDRPRASRGLGVVSRLSAPRPQRGLRRFSHEWISVRPAQRAACARSITKNHVAIVTDGNSWISQVIMVELAQRDVGIIVHYGQWVYSVQRGLGTAQDHHRQSKIERLGETEICVPPMTTGSQTSPQIWGAPSVAISESPKL
jgi:hypothetical protein